MDLSVESQRQFAWRSWATILEEIPLTPGQSVLDLGCGIGALAAELAARGARVTGVDMNPDLLATAVARNIPGVDFRLGNLREPSNLSQSYDGLWCSFTAAYFPDLTSMLKPWLQTLRPNAWVAVTEVDDLFGHRPLTVRTQELLDGYVRDAIAANRYDFRMGGRLTEWLLNLGCRVERIFTVPDQELSFTGPARPDVLEAWQARFDRMQLLQDFCGAEFDEVRNDFLACLTRPDHVSTAQVCCCIGRMPAAEGG